MPVTLGVLGAKNSISKQILQNEILDPILNDLSSKPVRMFLPAEPISSAFAEGWAGRHDIPVELVKSDFVKHGRKASILRDASIEKACSVLVVFEGPRSRYYMDLAERIAKRNPDKLIYVVEAKDVSPVLLEVEQVKPMFISDEVEEQILKQVNTLDKMWGRA